MCCKYRVLSVFLLAITDAASAATTETFTSNGFQCHREDCIITAYENMWTNADETCGESLKPSIVSDVREHEDQLGNIRMSAEFVCVEG